MVLSLLARHLTLGTTSTLAARVAFPAAPSVLTRRTFLATPHPEFPPATKKSDGAKTTSKKSTTTKTTKKASSTKNVKKDEKSKVTISKKDLPPKRPPGTFLLFFMSYLKSQPKAKTMEETQALAKRASEVWKTYSIAEKQPFYDENEVLKEQFQKERVEYFRNTSITTLKQINKSRRARGKVVVRRVTETPRPVTAFLRFVSDFRKSTDGQSIMTQTVPGKNHNIQLITAAGERWRSMTAEDQSPYFEQSRKAREEFNQAKQAATV
ncbi:hypothetical protein PAXRUDRAFT_827416 [Paxillus rubicundulus Ve08.2h10]|uniref:HMG box domain-containing protein n=1 Tax=Paxillus rubicundulus Ve08.2h10 TaxID=930991 RepID=A0A0D0E8K6_9AGAM|nr:hypothetical protein PAXRUDRAFT_827416 [Paxillus rubicundulus Ve08.2h10]